MSLGQAQRRVQAKLSLVGRLVGRRDEIEKTILARIYSVSDPSVEGDPEYVAGLRAAVGAAVDYGLAGLERPGAPTPIPTALFVQARQAARGAISLDTVLRRYFAGYTLLSEFVMQEARADRGLWPEGIHHLSRAQAALFDRIVVAITQEYRREADASRLSGEEVHTDRVKSLLAGELIGPAELGYELEGWHLGLIASGPGGAGAIRKLAAGLDRQLLLVNPAAGSAWAWLGGRRKVELDRRMNAAVDSLAGGVALGIGEPAVGISGWRLTHHQAAAALPVAIRSPRRLARYGEVSLLSAALCDEVLAESLHELYLAPLSKLQDGGATLRCTLRAYFDAQCNLTSAAATLGVTPKTVKARVRLVEEAVGRPLSTCVAELEVALGLEGLEGSRKELGRAQSSSQPRPHYLHRVGGNHFSR